MPTLHATPELPESLTFMQSGTPLEAIAETTYTLTATDSDGDEATLIFILSVMTNPMPTFGDTTVAARVYLQHRESDPLTLLQASRGDDNVNFTDFLTFAGKFGSRLGQERYDARGDLNGDSQIDFDDFLIFADSFGSTG